MGINKLSHKNGEWVKVTETSKKGARNLLPLWFSNPHKAYAALGGANSLRKLRRPRCMENCWEKELCCGGWYLY